MFQLATILLSTCITATLAKSKTSNAFDASIAAFSYAVAVRAARCQARCFRLFASEDADVNRNRFLIPPVCTTPQCARCLDGCSFKDGGSCAANCTEECADSCRFFRSLPNATRPSSDTSLTTSTPEVFCYDFNGPDDVYGVVLRWTLSGDNDTVPRAPAVSFVLQIRTGAPGAGAAASRPWATLGTRYRGLIPVTNLNSTERYQFRLTAVLEDGILHRPKTSAWTSDAPTAGPRIGPPVDIRVANFSVRNATVRSLITWSVTRSAIPSCHYDVHLLPDHPTASSAHFHLSKPYRLYNLEVSGLRFNINYTLHMMSTDAAGRQLGSTATAWFRTPSCLESYNFNFSVCAPGPPNGVRVRQARLSTEDQSAVGVQITWSPPAHTSRTNRVSEYHVVVREKLTPLAFARKTIHRVARSVDGSARSLQLANLPEGTTFEVLVRAETAAGLGQPAVTEYALPGLRTTVHRGGLTGQAWLWTCVSGVSLLSAVVILASWYFKRHATSRCFRKESGYEDDFYAPTTPTDLDPPPEFELLRRAATARKTSVDPFEVAYEDVVIRDVVGKGAFGIVRKAEVWIGKVRETVALKTLRDDATPQERSDLLQEMDVLRLVGTHPNVVSLRAYCTRGPVVALMVEYCPMGDLHSYLRRTKQQLCTNPVQREDSSSGQSSSSDGEGSTSGPFSDGDSGYASSPTASPGHFLSLLRQVALGMEFLSSKRVVHRDLAARNVLLYDEHRVKITDFGLSRDVYVEGHYRKETGGRLPVRWMALESLANFVYTSMSDVWSFGVLMWEVVSLGDVPYPGVDNHELLQFLRRPQGNRLAKPASCGQEVYDVMYSCWHEKPSHRPSFGHLVTQLDAILESSREYFCFNGRL